MKRSGWAVRAVAAMGLLVCGCGSGSFNPTPGVTALFPPQVTAGSASFTLFLSGNNFQSTTTAQWNGVNRPAVFNDSSGQMAMTILDTDVANPGTGQITVANPAPGGGLQQNAVSFVINPGAVNGPVITTVSPASATVGGSAAVSITVAGTNFVSTDQISFNGTPLTTTASGTPVQLNATIPAEDLSATELASIAVQTNTATIASPSVKFPIGPSSNPSPRLTSIAPTSTKIGTVPPGAYLLLTGTGFVPGSVVNFNSSPRPTGYSSSTQLAVSVLSSDVAAGGTISVTVTNPNPGGGNSSSASFSVQ
ncbi:MAG TPA: IPT/TIG domain-containing protein [Candidatus Acidoferrum sp.]|nr:IPT/TIG domain-containing protein [Candidatus Acidoferrum sp.]